MLLLARISLSESPASVNLDTGSQSSPEAVIPVPAPPPPDASSTSFSGQEDLINILEQQQTLTKQLDEQLSQQEDLIRDLETQLQTQTVETQTLAARLTTYEQSVSSLTSQQQRLAGVQQDTDQTQTSLLWVGAGLVLMVLIGGAVVVLILVVLVAFQSRHRQSQPNSIVYSADIPPPAYPYYQQEFLPIPKRPRRVQAQDVYDYD
ncbi:MAG: hypothetical protein O2890_10950 [Cyanobacteria bacterium]|nr:hypothetical protein [Cyanobacteriota bacterium]MDA0866915.1 hypothetical protein [Cyanobacteriota bacterium]